MTTEENFGSIWRFVSETAEAVERKNASYKLEKL